jgi:hypothetical protein
VIGLGGIIRKDTALFIGGSTEVSSDDGVDGFVLRIFKETGNPFGTDPATSGLVSSYRIASENGMNDFVNGICSSNSLSFFVTGSTKDGLGGGENYAFLMKFRALDLTPMWTVQLPVESGGAIVPEIEGISCATTLDGSSVYFVGNVLNGGVVSGSGIGSSFGGTDIFVAKVDEVSGEVLFVRQIGSPMNDVIAPGGGITVKSNGDAIVVGGSNGAIFQHQMETSLSEQYEAFLAIVTKDGSVPLTIFTQPPVTTVVPTAGMSSSETPTASPTSPVQDFLFTALTLRLEGAEPLTSQSRRDFESSLEDFYQEFYAGTKRRRLQSSDISNFLTSVTTVGERPDDSGNEIRYDQTISFTTEGQNFTLDDAKDLLIAPFAFVFTKDIFLDLLRSSNPDFQSVNSVGELDFPIPGNPSVVGPGSDEDSSGGVMDIMMDNLLYILIGFGFICLVAAAFYCRRRRANKRKAEKEQARPSTVAPIVPLEESRPGLQRRPSRAKRPGDYSAAYLKELDDFGQGSNDFGGFNQSFASNDYSSNSEQQYNSRHDKIRVNLPQSRARSRSRETLQRSRDHSDSDDSYGSDTQTESKNPDDFYDEEMPTPKKSGLIADFDDDDNDDDYSESYNSFLEKFHEEADEQEFPNGPDLEEASLPASVQSNLNLEAQSRIRERTKRRSHRRRDSNSFSEDSLSTGTSSHGQSEESDSDDSDPQIKVQKEPEDMSSFTAEDVTEDWVRGM